MAETERKCIVWRVGEEIKYGEIRDGHLKDLKCLKDSWDMGSIERLILNPESGEVFGGSGVRHEDILYAFLRKDMSVMEFIKTSEEHVAVERDRRFGYDVTLLYNQTKDGRERNARLLDGLRKMFEQKILKEEDVICVGTYVEHSEKYDACGKVKWFLDTFERCSLDTIVIL